MEKRANHASTQTAHPVDRVGLETKGQVGIDPVMPVRTKRRAKQNNSIFGVKRVKIQVQVYSDIHNLTIVEEK